MKMPGEKRQKQRNKTRNRNKKARINIELKNGVSTVSADEISSKSAGERLAAVVQTLRASGGRVDLRTNLRGYIKLATQVLSNPDSKTSESSLSLCLVSYLLTSSSVDTVEGSNSSERMNFTSQLLLPFAKVALCKIAPHHLQLHVPSLLFFRKLLSLQPAICLPIKTQLEEQLTLWFNTATVGRHAADDAVGSPADVTSLAADVWALLPVGSTAGLSGDADSRSAAGGAASVVRGLQLQRLLVTLDALLVTMLSNVVQPQGSAGLSERCAGVQPIKFIREAVPTAGKSKHKHEKHVAAPQPGPGHATAGRITYESSERDLPSHPLQRTRLLYRRCCNLLLFARSLLRTVQSGHNQHITLIPRDILVPVFRILQVSSSQLAQYRSKELSTLSRTWPLLQHRALHLLRDAINVLGSNFSPCYHLILNQLTTTLMSIVPSNRTSAATRGPKTGDRKAASSGSRPQVLGEKTSKTPHSSGDHRHGFLFDAVAHQETLALLLECLGRLTQVSRNMHGASLELLKTVLGHITLHVTADATIQNRGNKTISKLSIKKKSKRKGYSIVATSSSSSAVQTGKVDWTARPAAFNNLSLEKSFLIASNALEFLSAVIRFSPHYTLSADAARLLQESLFTITRSCCNHLRQYQGLKAIAANTYHSTSGLVDLRCFLNTPVLVAKLVGLLSASALSLHPSCPPPVAATLHLLQQQAMVHAHHTQIVLACEEGVQQITAMVQSPRVATFLQSVEDYKATNLLAGSSLGAVAREKEDVTASSESEDDQDEESESEHQMEAAEVEMESDNENETKSDISVDEQTKDDSDEQIEEQTSDVDDDTNDDSDDNVENGEGLDVVDDVEPSDVNMDDETSDSDGEIENGEGLSEEDEDESSDVHSEQIQHLDSEGEESPSGNESMNTDLSSGRLDSEEERPDKDQKSMNKRSRTDSRGAKATPAQKIKRQKTSAQSGEDDEGELSVAQMLVELQETTRSSLPSSNKL